MNKAYLTVGIILLSILAFAGLNYSHSYSTGNELDYYMLKETAQASMADAVDLSYGRKNGTIRIDKEKFVESFLKRFVNSVANEREYEIKIYDINEVPPKVSITVISENTSFNPGTESQAKIVTKIEGILMSNNKEDPVSTEYKSKK